LGGEAHWKSERRILTIPTTYV